MAAAFRSIQPGESVLAAIERLSGAKSSILLHDAPDEDAPILKVGGADAGGDARYQVVGEIARRRRRRGATRAATSISAATSR